MNFVLSINPFLCYLIAYKFQLLLSLMTFYIVSVRSVLLGRTINLIFSNENVFRFFHHLFRYSTSLAATAGTCSGLWCPSWNSPGVFSSSYFEFSSESIILQHIGYRWIKVLLFAPGYSPHNRFLLFTYNLNLVHTKRKGGLEHNFTYTFMRFRLQNLH